MNKKILKLTPLVLLITCILIALFFNYNKMVEQERSLDQKVNQILLQEVLDTKMKELNCDSLKKEIGETDIYYSEKIRKCMIVSFLEALNTNTLVLK